MLCLDGFGSRSIDALPVSRDAIFADRCFFGRSRSKSSIGLLSPLIIGDMLSSGSAMVTAVEVED